MLILRLSIILLFFPLLSFSQSRTGKDKNDSIPIVTSNYSLGMSLGYSGVFVNSTIIRNEFDKDFVNGAILGFIFEYKIPDTKAAILFSSETHQININFEDRINDNIQTVNLNMLGIKAGLGFADGLYVLPTVGIMTGIETQFIRSFNIGYEFTGQSKRSTFFYQVGYTVTDKKDTFLGINLGIKFNL